MTNYRTCVYIDGFNFYHSIHEQIKRKIVYYPSLRNLCENILKSLVDQEHSIEEIHYFTAEVSNSAKLARQREYINALKKEDVKIHYGKFVWKEKLNRYTEKRTDVNLATHLLNDAWLDKYDFAVVISGDADYLEAIRLAKKGFPGKSKKVIEVWAVGEIANDLKGAADQCRTITDIDLKRAKQIVNQKTMTTPRTGGEILIDGLIAYGVPRIFCVPGESYLAALDACFDRQDRIQLITCRQEGGAAYMAEAHAKLTGAPGVCFVSRGPGAANAMVGIHTAFQDSTPVLLLVGQVSRATVGREAFQELDCTQVYGGATKVAKAVLRIEQAADIPQQLFDAWTIAISERPGPVVIELPEDMLREQAIVADGKKPVRPTKIPSGEAIARFSELLQQSQRPVIIFGGAAWTVESNHALAEFSEKHRIPAACAFRRQDMFDNTHPHYIGELGIAPNPELVALVKDSDLVIALGARLGEMTTSNYTLFEVPEFDSNSRQKLVHVFPSSAELNSVYRAELGIDCDAINFLAAVKAIPASNSTGHAGRGERIASAHRSYLEFMQQPRDQDAPVRMDQVMTCLRERLPADAIITNGAGNYTVWAQRNYQFRQPKTQLASTNGSMGYGVPAAIAAKLVRPQSTVVSFSGDGCFLMNGQELATAIQYRLNILFLIINNQSYGTIRNHQQRAYPDRPIATALNNPDFVALAQAHGAFGVAVTKTEQFATALDDALAAERPALIELRTDY